jgi:hypothetical protein
MRVETHFILFNSPNWVSYFKYCSSSPPPPPPPPVKLHEMYRKKIQDFERLPSEL